MHCICFALWQNMLLSDFSETAISHAIFRLDRHVGTSFSEGQTTAQDVVVSTSREQDL